MKDYPPPKKKKKKKKKKGSGSLPSPRSGYATTITVFFSSPGTNVLGELMPYPRCRRCRRRCRRRRCRRRRQFQVKVSVY